MIWILAVLVPFIFIKSPFLITIFTLVLINYIAALGLNIIMGYAGQISIGHAAFMSLGAYTSVLLFNNFGLPLPVTVLTGGLVALIFGLIIGFPALRLSGFYLAIATMGFVVAVEQLLGAFEHLTGGHMGIRNIQFPYLWNQDVEKFLFALALVWIIYTLTQNMIKSKYGRALMALRENETASSVVGINISNYKLLAFAYGSMLAGIAGALYAHTVSYIAPSDFGIAKSLDLLAIVVIGGIGTLDGPLYGSLVYIALPFLFSRSHIPLSIVFGALLIIVVLFMPRGLSYYLLLFRLKYLNKISAFLRRGRKMYGQLVETPVGKIHYLKKGNGKKNVIFVHGNFASGRWFIPLMEKLPENEFNSYTLDLPNFGYSDELPREVSIEKYADALKTFTDAMKINKFILVGHSLGGAVVMNFTIKYPEMVEKLILVDPAPVNGLKTPEESYPVLELYKNNPEILKAALKMIAPTYTNEEFFNLVTADALRMQPKCFTENARALEKYDFTDAVKIYNGEVVVIYGDKDPILSLEQMEKTTNAFRNGKLFVLKDIGHSPVVEAPERVIEQITTNTVSGKYFDSKSS